MSLLRQPLLWAAFLILTIAVSLVLFILRPHTLDKRTLFFPDRRSLVPMTEYRFVPSGADTQSSLHFVVQALFQGPTDITLGRIVPRNSRATAVFVYGPTAVINIDALSQMTDAMVPLSGQERIQWLERTVRYNFPFVTRVVIQVNGQEAVF